MATNVSGSIRTDKGLYFVIPNGAIMNEVYIDYQGGVADFEGEIQCDLSGVGHCWRTLDPDDVDSSVMEALADESGEIIDGAIACVGGMSYRAKSAL